MACWPAARGFHPKTYNCLGYCAAPRREKVYLLSLFMLLKVQIAATTQRVAGKLNCKLFISNEPAPNKTTAAIMLEKILRIFTFIFMLLPIVPKLIPKFCFFSVSADGLACFSFRGSLQISGTHPTAGVHCSCAKCLCSP